MTAEAAENERARAAQTAGESAAEAHAADAAAQHRISGSTVAVEDAATSDDHSVGWFGSDRHLGPGPSRSPNADKHVSFVG